MNKISDIYEKKIFTDNSDFVGTAKDVLIDPKEGRVKYLIKGDVGSLLGREKEDARQFMKENFIPFERVVAIRDIIIVKG